MADISPGQFPQDPSIASVKFRSVTPIIRSETTAGKVRRVAQGHTYFTFEITYPPLTPVDLGEVTGFLAATMHGQYSFEIVLPRLSSSKAPFGSVANANIRCAGSVVSGQKYVRLTNCGSQRTVLYAGDFFKFNTSTHSKVYMVTTDCVSDTSGNANVQIGGSVLANVVNNTTLITTNVPFTVVLEEPEQAFDSGYGGITTMTINMRETW